MAQEQPPGVPLDSIHLPLQIPNAAQQTLLPKSHLSVLQFLEFLPPGIKHGASAFFHSKILLWVTYHSFQRF
jgi:hypothetical protein